MVHSMKSYLVIYVDPNLEVSERWIVNAASAKAALKVVLAKHLKSFVDPEEIQECVDRTIESSFRKTDPSKGGSVWTAADDEGYWLVTGW